MGGGGKVTITTLRDKGVTIGERRGGREGGREREGDGEREGVRESDVMSPGKCIACQPK